MAIRFHPDFRRLVPTLLLATMFQQLAVGRLEPCLAADVVQHAIEVTQHDVLPILLRRCIVCHGLRRQEGGLDLRTKSSMLKGGQSGPAIVPGKPAESLLVKRISADQMPPKKFLLDVGVKPVREGELTRMVQWIEQGAPETPAPLDVAGTPHDPLVQPADRRFWAFQPPRQLPPPALRQTDTAFNPIDAFVLAGLERKGLTFSVAPDRRTLLRRATFDLTGLPPTPGQVQAFLDDADPNAYEKVIDRLLASPRYGERWGRYWLDAAGYADSWGGKLSADHIRPHAWRYRDYVIGALNADKPYDRFLIEQIAGDELVDYENVPRITQEIYENLVATGFLRMGPDSTSEREVSFVPDRLDVIADQIDIFSSAVLGLTMRCARCHDHKYDPLPQRDYYRLTALLRGAFDEHDWLKPRAGTEKTHPFDVRLLPHVTTKERQDWDDRKERLAGRVQGLRGELQEKADGLRKRYREERLAKLPEGLRGDLRKMLITPPERRDEVLKYLAGKFEEALRIDRTELEKIDAGFKQLAAETTERIEKLEASLPPEPKIQALWDRGTPSPAYIYRRGDYQNAGEPVAPGVPAVLSNSRAPLEIRRPWPGAKQTGRRLALARWLVRPDHPLTARVMVNRAWKNHFGRGIVQSVGDFGQAGTAPTHPELLDWLAVRLMGRGWSLKSMHRLMMTSRTYRQSSGLTAQHQRLDPENRGFSRMPLTRMEAEVLRDTMLFVSGRLDEARFGPPDPVDVRDDGLVTPVGTESGWRRSIYVRQRRTETPTILDAFDLPQQNPNCVQRRKSTVTPQALHLINNATVYELAAAFAQRVRREAGAQPTKQIEHMYRLALSRPPGEQERKAARKALAELTTHWARQDPVDQDPAMRALHSLCHAVFNTAVFLYIN